MSNPLGPSSEADGARPDWASLATLAVRLAWDIAGYSGRRGVAALALVGLGALTEGVGLFMIIPIVTVALGAAGEGGRRLAIVQRSFDRLGVHDSLERLAILLALFAAVTSVRAAVVYARDLTLNRLQAGFIEARRAGIATRLAAARWDVIARIKHARINQVMNADIQRIASAASLMQQSAVSLVMLAAQGVIALALSPALAVFTGLFVAISAVSLAPILRRAFDMGTHQTRAGLRLMDATGQFLGGLKLAISQDLQGRFVAEYRQSLDVLGERQTDYTRSQQRRRLILTLLSTFTAAAVVLVGFGVLKLPPAILFTVLLVLLRTSGPLAQLQQSSGVIAQALPAYASVTALADDLIVAPGAPDPAEAPRAPPYGPVVFIGVGFQHPNAHDLDAAPLRNFNLIIQPGGVLGVTGPSGAGKTTFADLLSGLYPPDAGEIQVGGASLTGAVLRGWRRQISYVSQDPLLFHDSIRRNLAWAAPDGVTEDELWAALALAGADALVRRMDQGLETVVGERGSLVSGGERQRLALARALLRKPRLLILDEATNAIDVPGERQVLQRLVRLTPRPTIVMIAHRTESLGLCDRVVALKNGGLELAA